MVEVLLAGVFSMVISIVAGPKFIEFLRKNEFGQHVREEGPEGHWTKQGTPAMGGLLIMIAMSIPFLLFSNRTLEALTAFFVTLGCAAVGFVDDWTKVSRRRSLGLAARTATIAILTYTAMSLVAALTAVRLGQPADPESLDLAILGASLIGASIGFLWYNAFPAQVFMGDTGSMGLGGALAAFAIMTKTEVLLILIGGIFLIEALSVMLQGFTFKFLGRRVLLMAPLHHHFEMKAWSETRIMVRFWIAAAIFCACAFVLYYQSFSKFAA